MCVEHSPAELLLLDSAPCKFPFQQLPRDLQPLILYLEAAEWDL